MISETEIKVLSEVQRLPLTTNPFAEIASRLNMDEKKIIEICKNLMEKGIIRRFGPSISHRNLGFQANPMTVIKVPEDKLEEVGLKIAAESEVTHCYARSGWEYNLFFMVHKKTKEDSIKLVNSILNKIGDFEYRILFSVKELKKISFEIQKNHLEVKS